MQASLVLSFRPPASLVSAGNVGVYNHAMLETYLYVIA